MFGERRLLVDLPKAKALVPDCHAILIYNIIDQIQPNHSLPDTFAKEDDSTYVSFVEFVDSLKDDKNEFIPLTYGKTPLPLIEGTKPPINFTDNFLR